MHEEQTGPSASEGRLEEIIAEYLRAQRKGTPMDQQVLIARFPELAESLQAFFADDAQMRRLTPPDFAPIRAEETAEATTPGGARQDSVSAPTIGSTSGTPSGEAPAVGDTVRYFGDYQLIEEIAHGGMGVVFKARQVTLNRIVALKMILSGQFASRADVQRFRSEAEAAAKLDHRNIVPIYEVGEYRGLHYYTMRLMEGASLSGRLGEFAVPAVDPATGKDLAGTVWTRAALHQRQDGIAILVATVATAVHYAHQHGVLHRDLKPANILLDRNGVPHVTDFGIAKQLDAEGGAAVTHTGAVLGTPAFMAPEQASGKKGITTAADVYSVGAILYQLLTSRPPFGGESALETLRQVQEREPVAPTQINPALDRDLSTICLKCLQKDPARRYGSAEALGRDLDRWRAGEPIIARPSTAWERAVKWVRRRPAIAGLSAAVVLVAICGFIAVVLAWRNTEVARQAASSLAMTEARARQDAQRANEAAQAAREAERKQRNQAEAALESANINLYFDRIKLAYGAWTAGNISEALAQLDACPTGLRQWEWRYLEHLCHMERLTLPLPEGAEAYIHSIGYSRDGNRILGFTKYGFSDAIVWDAADGRVVRKFTTSLRDAALVEGQGIRVRSAALSADGKSVAIGSADGSVDLRSIATGAIERHVGKMKDPIESVSLSPDGRLLAATAIPNDGRVTETTVWSLDGGAQVYHRDNAQVSFSPDASFSPDGRRLLVATRGVMAAGFFGANGHQMQLVDTTTWKDVLALGWGDAVAFSGDGRKVVLSNRDRTGIETIKIVDTATAAELLSFRPPAYVADLALNTDGSQIAAAGDLGGGHLIWVWDGTSGASVATFRGHRSEVQSLAFSPDGSRLATSSADGVVKIWDPRSAGEVNILPNRAPSNPTSVAFDHDLSLAAFARAGSANRFTGLVTQITLWDVRAGREMKSLIGHRIAPSALALSPDGATLISGGRDGTARSWDTATGKSRYVLDTHGNIVAVAISPDGRWAASAEEVPLSPTPPYDYRTAAPVRVWDTKTGQERSSFRKHPYGASAVCFSPDGAYVVSASSGEIRLWDPATGTERQVIDSSRGTCYLIVFSPDGRQFATAGIGNSDAERAVFIWDAMSGKLLHTLSGHGSYLITGISFSPDGRRIATAAGNMVKICDCAGGMEILSLPGITNTIRQIAFSTDGQRLLAVSQSGAMGYWDATPR